MVFIRNLDLKSGSMKRGGRGLMQKKKILGVVAFSFVNLSLSLKSVWI